MYTPKILVINGPNLNFLGTREPQTYGKDNLIDLYERLEKEANEIGAQVKFYQSNHEGTIVDRIQQAFGEVDFILINAGAYTHTSVAILDALSAVNIPFFEIHISNVHARESFRHHSFLSAKAQGVIVGFGLDGYSYALLQATKLARAAHKDEESLKGESIMQSTRAMQEKIARVGGYPLSGQITESK